jgi:hypothetical protein
MRSSLYWVVVVLIMLHKVISPVESRRLRLDTSPSGGGCTLRQYVRRSEVRVGSPNILNGRMPMLVLSRVADGLTREGKERASRSRVLIRHDN